MEIVVLIFLCLWVNYLKRTRKEILKESIKINFADNRENRRKKYRYRKFDNEWR